MRKYLFLTILLSCLSIGAMGQVVYPTIDLSGLPEATTAQTLRYWFDDDIGTDIQALDVLGGSTTTIDVSSLVDGIHMLHYQIVDSKGVAGVPASRMFVKVGATLTATKLRYWFDDEQSGATEIALSNAQTIDASALVDGIHILHYQTVDNKGDAGIPVSKMFMKMGSSTAVKAIAIQYWFDENDAQIKETDIKNLTATIDASTLDAGEHTLHYQLKLSDGTLSPAASATFDATQLLKGDANGDGSVTISDAVTVVNFILGNPPANFIFGTADTNKDGSITITDAVGIVNIILNGPE